MSHYFVCTGIGAPIWKYYFQLAGFLTCRSYGKKQKARLIMHAHSANQKQYQSLHWAIRMNNKCVYNCKSANMANKELKVIQHLLRWQLLLGWYPQQQRVRVRVKIGFLVRGRVRIKIRIRIRVRVGVTFNVIIYHRSNCHRSKCCTFIFKWLCTIGPYCIQVSQLGLTYASHTFGDG